MYCMALDCRELAKNYMDSMRRPFVLFYFHFAYNLSLLYLFVLYHRAIMCAALH